VPLSDAERLQYLRLKKQKAQAQQAQPAEASPEESFMEKRPPLEILTSVGSRLVAGPAGLAAGTAGLVMPGPTGQGADWMEKTQNALTYEPRGKDAQAAVGAVMAPFEAIAEGAQTAGQFVARKTDSPFAGSLTEATINMAPALVAAGVRGMRPKATSKAPEMLTAEDRANLDKLYPNKNKLEGALVPDAELDVGGVGLKLPEEVKVAPAPETIAPKQRGILSPIHRQTWEEARALGFKGPPNLTDPSMTRAGLEMMAGRQPLRQALINENQMVANKVGAKVASLPEGAALDAESFAAARTQLAKPYNEIAALDPQAKALWLRVQAMRAKEQQAWNQYRNAQVKDPALKAKAERLGDLADAKMGEIADIADYYGKPDLKKSLLEARKKFAQNYDIEKVTNVGSGNVEVARIGQMVQKNPKRYSGEFLAMGKFARAFPQYVGRVAEVTDSDPHIGLGLSSSGVHGFMFQKGVPVVRDIARSMSLSDLMQQDRMTMGGLGLKTAGVIDRNSVPLSMLPTLGIKHNKIAPESD
jgi:hypothetical protein